MLNTLPVHRLIWCLCWLVSVSQLAAQTPPQHLVLVMADDMGWGQTGYYQHPLLQTPHLDELARQGLRFDRFYAGAPNCSPTRATVLTGRTHDRTGVLNHGVPLRPQERTIAQALQQAGYVTAHFGKWHLNGLRGPGAPTFKEDIRSPGAFGFEEWLSVTNFFDRDPILSRQGEFEEFTGDSSEIIVEEALKFLRSQVLQQKRTLTVIWYGTPHSPFFASPEDKAQFSELKEPSRSHYGELVAMDRSIGTLRAGLRELQIEEQTLLWFCSDNGGLPRIEPDTVGGLRGYKGSVYEGGLRVPCVVAWPGQITPRITSYPASTLDIFPTIRELLNLPETVAVWPQDGASLVSLFREELTRRENPIGFRHTGRGAWIDNHFKLITQNVGSGEYELYNLTDDPQEQRNLLSTESALAKRLIQQFEDWNGSIAASIRGEDYPEKRVVPLDPGPRTWMDLPEYAPYLDDWKSRKEFRNYIK